MASEDRLFVLYTSGSTGKPKGVVHTTAGYNLWAHLTFQWIFDLRENDIHWCTADVGWITGHTYIVYGPPLQWRHHGDVRGGTTALQAGGLLGGDPEAQGDDLLHRAHRHPRLHEERPRGARSVRHEQPAGSSARVGEPINPEAWMWYREVIGGDRCPVVDTWWQTETGGVMISPLPGATPTKPGSCHPAPAGHRSRRGGSGGQQSQGADQGGYLAVRRPWPGMMRTVHGDPERFRKSYWEHIRPADGSWLYFAGDGARRDADGYYWVMGRVDDVINVSGHRLGTMEIESALVSHPAVAEAAVVGRPDELKGEGIVAFVTLDAGRQGEEPLIAELRRHVGKEIGPIARPDEIRFTDALPKTRSGKIMRRILRALAAGEEVSGDTSTLEDRSVLDALRV